MIHINNLSFMYNKKRPILKNISTTLRPGNTYGLLGLNGEGKTTLLKLLSGLVFPKNGDIKINTIDSKSRNISMLEQIYFLPDTPKAPKVSADYYVEIYSPFYKNFSHDFFNEALQEFGINTNEYITSLSLGQQKKVHLVFALATNTQYLLLDEPTNGLDIPSKAIFRKLLAKSITDEKTIIISTHLVKDIENLIDHLLILKDGNLVFDQNTYDILQKYKFVQSNQEIEETIYTEQVITTRKNILTNNDNSDSNIDIELLFNAVQNNKL